MSKIAREISKAIKESKWLDISYKNVKGETTFFWIAIFDIDFKKKMLKVSIFNDKKSLDTIDFSYISFDGIQTARIIDFSTYDVPNDLIEKLNSHPYNASWLEYDHFDNNILMYYKECCYLDVDPYQSDYCVIDGIDINVLKKKKSYTLNDKQLNQIIKKIYHYDINNDDSISSNELIISVLAIADGAKKYLACYYNVLFDPQAKTLRIRDKLRFNKSFLIEGRRHSLSNYISMNVDEFIENFKEKYIDEYRPLLIDSLKTGEVLDEMPDMMILKRDFNVKLEQTYYSIEERYFTNSLSVPLKSFFGNISRANYNRKVEPSIVIYDDRINIDQMRVLYNAMKYPVTYVQGPPGTGKTQTILNVVLSAFLNSKTTLICSSNNRPVNGILEKIDFSYRGKKVIFPYLRLGRFEDVIKATLRIRELYELDIKDTPIESKINRIADNNNEKNAKLVELLTQYEEFIDIEECLNNAERFADAIDIKDSKMYGKVQESIKALKEKKKSTRKVQDSEVLELFTPVRDDIYFSSYLYFKSIAFIKKLHLPRYKELLEICYIQDDTERVSSFNRWVQSDDNIKLLIGVFPIIFSTNISSSRLGTGKFQFDLVIMDESGQCNPAHALLPIARATNLLLVGDPNQLKPVITLQEDVNENLKEKYNISNSYDYCTNSILDIMKNHDNISRYILLRYHYRCGRKIINFSNQRYYNNQLNIDAIKETGELQLLNIKNVNRTERNTAFEEAKAIVDYIKRNNLKDTTIVTPFVNQQSLLKKMLDDNGINDVSCGTIHSIQGAEKDTIIISSALSAKTSKATYDWIKNNAELINVATTRAKKRLIVAADMEVLNILSNDKKDDFYNLINYISNNGNVEVPASESVSMNIGFSNGSKSEDEFFKTMTHFCSCYPNYVVKRNVSFSEVFADDSLLSKSKQEFDIVLYKKVGLFSKKTTPQIAIEVNGGEHFGNIWREKSDKKKMEICTKKGIKLIFISNSMVKSYEYVRSIICSCKGKEFDQLTFENEFDWE